MAQFVVHPDSHREFPGPHHTFCLLTQADRAADFALTESVRYREVVHRTIEADQSLAEALRDPRTPTDADVFVICPDRFLVSPEPAEIGPGRRLAVMPCGSTPVTDAHVAYFLDVVQRTDSAALEARADRLFEALGDADEVLLADHAGHASARLGISGDYEWNQQAGVLGPGEQQIAPSGEASAAPTGLYRFDTASRLALHGSIALRGAPIVHRGDDPAVLDEQADLLADLDVLRDATIVLDLADGAVTDVRAIDPAGQRAVDALGKLHAADESYRIVWEFGIGLNPELVQQPGNCGLNEMFGGADGTVHLGFGLTPTTRYALTFTCADTVITDAESGIRIAGSRPRRPRGDTHPAAQPAPHSQLWLLSPPDRHRPPVTVPHARRPAMTDDPRSWYGDPRAAAAARTADLGALRTQVDDLLDAMIAKFYAEIPYADHQARGEELNLEYYKRHNIETILRLRRKRTIDALAINYFTKRDPVRGAAWAHYVEDEMLHDEWFAGDLGRIGVTKDEIYSTDPFQATKLLTGYLQYGMEFEGTPLALLCSVYFVEYTTTKTQPSWVKNLEEKLGREKVAGARRHVGTDIDDEHADFVWGVLTSLVSSTEDEAKVIQHMRIVANLWVAYFLELYQAVVAPAKNSFEAAGSLAGRFA
ncbi:iron-containing redox enzyme family protein [Candidatus Frankia nodulisporulans]|uniref:iron-containing redox enzyme family protein n=1 Tax=Candidatus Frankia nodulisporulans TaxID=2060052 RepID=UPI0037046843